MKGVGDEKVLECFVDYYVCIEFTITSTRFTKRG